MRLKHIFLTGATVLLLSAGVQAQALALSDEHRTWLEREVASIISTAERDYFLSLRRTEDRDTFIEAFWLAHDPTPGTARNEFREENQRRLIEVNRRFGNMLWPGTSTARGKVYMRQGEPVQIIRYQSPELTSYMEAWLYPPDRSAGIRYNYYILFYRPESKGDLEPFCPGEDEPGRLLAADGAGRNELKPEDALRKLLEIDPLLGQLSLSMLPIEHHPIMINNRFDLRRALARRNDHGGRIIKTLIENGDYGAVKRLKRIKAIMRGDDSRPAIRYTRVRVNLPYRFHVLRGENGRPRLLYSFAMDGKRVSAVDSYGKCYATLEVDLNVVDNADNLVRRKTDIVTASLDLWNVHNGAPGDIIHQDYLDLPPGDYRVEAEIRSPLDGALYSFGDRVTVPNRPAGRLELSYPVLLQDGVSVPAHGEDSPYTIFGDPVFPANEQAVDKGRDATFYYQLYFPRRDRTSTVEVRYVLRSGDNILWQDEERLNALSLKPGSFFSQKVRIPSGSYPPGVYSIEIVAKALSPPEARSGAEFSVRDGAPARGVPTLASIEREGP